MITVNTPKGQVVIRELDSIEDMQAAEEIQLRVWGMDIHPHPKEILIPIQHEGGLLAGAFYGKEMVGIVLGFPTRDPAVQHSQILATLSEWRGMGIGARLKWFQRDWCLQRSISTVRWTVDPLRTANAALNIHQLGGISSTYYVDYYGTMQGIDAGAPTDRLLVEWHLMSKRVQERASQRLPDDAYPSAQPALIVTAGQPSSPDFTLGGPQVRIPLPEDYIKMCQTDLLLALEWRKVTRGLFLHYFTAGYTINDFSWLGGPTYILEKRVL